MSLIPCAVASYRQAIGVIDDRRKGMNEATKRTKKTVVQIAAIPGWSSNCTHPPKLFALRSDGKIFSKNPENAEGWLEVPAVPGT